MLIPSFPSNEAQRLAELHALAVLDTPGEALFDDVVKLSAHITGCPISLISLIDTDRQWFKAKVGVDVPQLPRSSSFCGHAILQDEPLVVPNACEDARFANNPLVLGEPNIRFYVGHPLVTSTGFRLGTLCVIDVTPRSLSQTQMALLKSLARQATFLLERRHNDLLLDMMRRNTRTLFEKSPALILTTKGPQHVLEYVNAAHAKLLVGPEQKGKTLLEVSPDAQESGLLALVDEVYQQGCTKTIEDGQFQIDGQTRHLDLFLTPSRGLDGKVDGVMGMVNDNTQRKELELELLQLGREKEARAQKLGELFEQVPVHLASLEGPRHHFQFANRLYRDAFLPGAEYEGRAVADIFPQPARGDFVALLDSVYATGEPFFGQEVPYNIEPAQAQPKIHYFDYIVEAEKNVDGKITGIFIAARDVTDQVRARTEILAKVEALRAEREVRNRFVATLTHDLRTPLTAARVSAQRIARKARADASLSMLASRIIASIDRTEGMVRDLLDASRIEAGRGYPIDVAACELRTVMARASADLTANNTSPVQLREEVAATQVYWDASAVQRVVENLVSNALKYGEEGAPVLVGAVQQAGAVEISVHNQGSPIPQREQELLFESYHRADAAVESGHKGWGIGLTLVKGIAEAHRGTVRVESASGKGTTFFVTLPVDCRTEVSSA